MNTILSIGIVLALVLVVAGAIIVFMGLKQHSTLQWKTRVKGASQAVMQREPLSSAVKEVPAQKVSFQRLWEDESREGSAYVDLDFQTSVSDSHGSGGPTSSQEEAPKAARPQFRTSLQRRFPTLHPVEGWVENPAGAGSDRIIA